MRKINGKYWTVQYENPDGSTYNVGHEATYARMFERVCADAFSFPEGVGKIICTR